MSYNKCYNLQFAVSCISSASIVLVITAVLALFCSDTEIISITTAVSRLIVTIILLALNCIINWRLYRWFNTERAIAKTLQEGGDFQGNLLPDSLMRFGSSISFAGGMGGVMTLLTMYGRPWMILAALVIGAILHVATLIFAAILAVRAARWKVERSEWEDRKIAIYTLCSRASDGTRTTKRRMKDVGEAENFYMYV